MTLKKYLNIALALMVAMIMIISMYSCDNGNEGDGTPPDDDPGASQGPEEGSGETEINKPSDGLSEDKTYYQLTDKNGRVIRIPIGVSLSADENGTISASSSEVKSTSKRISLTSSKAEPIDDTDQKSIYVFSPLSIISFGYGDIKNPAKSGYLYESDSTPFSADEDHILVVQCLDADLNAVEPTDASAYYIYAYILDYKTNPDGLMFSEIIEYSAQSDELINYFTFSNVVFGTPYTSKSVTTQTDPETGATTTIYRKVEEVTLRYPGGVLVIPLKQYYCNSDWTVKYWYEYTYDSNSNLIMEVHYDHADRIIFKQLYDENGNVDESYSYEYYENGQLQTVSEPNFFATYEEDGTVIETSTREESSPGNYVWHTERYNPFLGGIERVDAVYVNYEFEKELYYAIDADWIFQVKYYTDDGRFDHVEDYDENGILISTRRYEYQSGTSISKEYATWYNPDGSVCSTHETLMDGVFPVSSVQKDYENGELTFIFEYEYYPNNGGLKHTKDYYGNGQLFSESFYEEDGSYVTFSYDENGNVTYKAENTYEDGVCKVMISWEYKNNVLVQKQVYYYDNLYSTTIYDANGNVVEEYINPENSI